MHYRFIPSAFLLGLFASVKINLLGELYLGEILGLGYVTAQIFKLCLSREQKRILLFASFWAGAQLVSDIYNETEALDAMKGVLSPVIFGATFAFIGGYLKNDIQRCPAMLTGIILGGIVQLILFPNPYFLLNYWKWGLGSAALGLFAVYVSFYFQRVESYLIFGLSLCFSTLSLALGSRSLAVFPLIASIAYSFFHRQRVETREKTFIWRLGIIKSIIIALPLLIILNYTLGFILSSEAALSLLPSDSATTYRLQAAGAYGLLLGGRSEVLASLPAFWDKPLLGHGSWAKDIGGYQNEYLYLRYQLGYLSHEGADYTNNLTSMLIPTHSYLMAALVWAGVMGGAFWLITLQKSLQLFINNAASLPYYFYVGITDFTWNVFFSPFGASSRWNSSVFLAVLFASAKIAELKRKSVVR